MVASENQSKYIKKIFICCAYLYSNDKNKDIFAQAENAYKDADRDHFKEAWAVADYLKSENIADNSKIADLKVRVLKGGSYKIKDYYLENYSLSDIRGASNLLSHVEENVIPGIIAERFIESVIIYNGGGNIFAILPAETEDAFALELENIAQKYLISASVAYTLSDEISVKDIFGVNYNETMRKVENDLDKRKKVKIVNALDVESEMLEQELMAGIKVMAKPCDTGMVCEACRVRKAVYIDDAKRNVCAGCLHKVTVGRRLRSEYLKEYENYTQTLVSEIKTLVELGDKIAVVYGDGNNMGGIIQNFTKITDMMEFSEKVKLVARQSVFESMRELKIEKFEIVGLGGDDIFVIVPGDKAVKFSVMLAKKYRGNFDLLYPNEKDKVSLSTMSVGIAIGKNDTPVKILLKEAEKKLSDAKSYSKRRTDIDDGSISFSLLTEYEGSINTDIRNGMIDTLLPYSVENAEKIIGFAEDLSRSVGKTRLRNILDGYRNAETPDESDLYFEYINAKETSDKKINLCQLNGYTISSGHYNKDGKSYFIWKDILDLYQESV